MALATAETGWRWLTPARSRVAAAAREASRARWLVVVIPYALAARPLPHPLPHRLQDLAVEHARSRSRPTCRSSISPAASPASSTRLKQFTFDNYVWLTEDALYFRAYLSSLVDRRRLDLPRPPRRLPDRLRHGARAAGLAADAGDAGHPAVLDLVPDPRLRLDRHPQEGGAAQPVPALDRRHRRAADHPQHQLGGLYRHRLFLPAVHGAAALRGAREARPDAARGRRRSRLPAGHAPSGRSPSRCRCPASSPAASWSSSRSPASSSSPTCSAAPTR